VEETHTAKPPASVWETIDLAALPLLPTMPRGIVGAVELEVKTRENPGKSPQFDHESIRPRVFSFSTFYIAKLPELLRKS
jgi:hypothetical protein